MKKINVLLVSLLATMTLFMTGCKGSDDEEVAPVGPSIVLRNNAGATTGDVTVTPSTALEFVIVTDAGDKNVKTVKVFMNGNAINGVNVNGKAKTNPFNVNKGTEYKVAITASSTETATVYKFVVTDKAGLTATKSVTVTTEVPSATLTTKSAQMIFNFSGAKKGSYDFDGLDSVASADVTGDIQDKGLLAGSYTQKFEVENGATMVKITSAEFDAATNEKAIKDLYAGTKVTVSDVYSQGDSYVIKTAAGKYVAMKITDVNVTTAVDDNNDSITFDVKYPVVSAGK